MAIYSHSKISTFENCPYQYKLRYIDKIIPEISQTIESFMGNIVHKALEKLYNSKKFDELLSKKELIEFYNKLWEKDYSDDILIVKSSEGFTSNNYKRMGARFISDYYDRMFPFDQINILGLETQDKMVLPNGDYWHVRIDKLGCDSEGNYFVCDYKTNSRMKFQQEADSDRQLAMYSIWVKDKFKDSKKVKLIWHMLAFNKDVVSERTDEQLGKLQEQVILKIKEIQEAEKKENFPTNVTPLCNYCGFKSQCPSFTHQFVLNQKKEIIEFKKDEGLQLVDGYSGIKKRIEELKFLEEEFKEKLISYSNQFGVDVVYGSNMKCSVKEFDKLVMPSGDDREEFINLMKEKGIYDDCSMICYPKLNSKILKEDFDQEIKEKVDIVKDYRLSLSKKNNAEEE